MLTHIAPCSRNIRYAETLYDINLPSFMMKHLLQVGLVLGAVLMSGCVQPIFSVNKVKDLKADQTVRLVGVVKTGAQIGTDYHINHCAEPLYLIDDTGLIKLDVKDEKYLNKKVEMTGRYRVPICEALCICDPKILVETIKIIE